jgi:predicted transcriptional regulator
MPFLPGNKLSPPPPKRFKGDSMATYVRARRAGSLAVFGMSHLEIANAMGCSKRTVYRYLAMPEIRARVNDLIEASDRRLAMLRFVSIVAQITRSEELLDQLEKSLGRRGEADDEIMVATGTHSESNI